MSEWGRIWNTATKVSESALVKHYLKEKDVALSDLIDALRDELMRPQDSSMDTPVGTFPSLAVQNTECLRVVTSMAKPKPNVILLSPGQEHIQGIHGGVEMNGYFTPIEHNDNRHVVFSDSFSPLERSDNVHMTNFSNHVSETHLNNHDESPSIYVSSNESDIDNLFNFNYTSNSESMSPVKN